MSETITKPVGDNNCPQCGAPLPAGGLVGLCPGCLLRQAATETAAPTGVINFQPPTVEELAKLFPQLEIISLIGRGGMGAVYKARQPLLDRIIAIKILPELVTRGTDFSERFGREARALAKLHHPNIVMVHEFGEINGQPYFIMEYVDGVNLRQLEREGKLSPREALQIVPQICEALQFAHDAGIVHRDIKPDNILLDKKGRVKIADFGIAKILGTTEDPAMPTTQGAIGTPHYMAPEQVEKPQTVDHRADIFSLGVVFYEMLTGELPLGKFGPPSASPRALQVDVRLDEVVLRALERKPEMRFQHASQVKTAVETIASTQAGASFGTGTPTPEIKVEEFLTRDYRLQIRHAFKRGWALVKSEFWPLVGITALIIVLIALAGNIIISRVSDETTGGTSLLGLVLNGPLIGGLYLYFLKKIRRQPTSVETAFAGFSKRFLHLFLANLVMTLLTVLGFVCFILPGIYLLVAWWFTFPLVMDKGMEFWPAMELSRKMITKHWWKMGLFMLAFSLVCLLGLCFCGIGIFIAAPIAIAAFLYAYEDIFGNVPPPSPLRPATPGSPSFSQPTPPAAGAAFGPAGTMVMPESPANSAGAGSPPPPTAGTPSLQGGEPSSPAIKPARSTSILLIGFLLFVGILGAIGISVASHANDWRLRHENLGLIQYPDGSMELALPPKPDSAPAPAGSSTAESPNANEAVQKSALTARTRAELENISARFDQLTVSASSPSNVLVTFAGLEQRVNSPSSTDDSGLVITNEHSTVSISAGNGIQIKDQKRAKHVGISVGGLRINVNGDQPGDWQKIEGSLVGSKLAEARWLFLGAGKLAAVRFEMVEEELRDVLPFVATTANSHENLMERMDAAQTITDTDIRDKSLTALAKDAVNAKEMDLAKSALGQIFNLDLRDAVTRDVAVMLAKSGLRKQAIDLAKGISDMDIRDKALSELAQ